MWREAVRNVGSGAAHALVLLLAFLAVALGLGSVATRGVVGVTADAAAFRDAGASVFRLDVPGGIDGATCDALAGVDGIDAAGATRAGDALRFALLPGLPVPYLDATAGMAALLGAEPAVPGAGLVVAAGLAESLGVATVPEASHLARADGAVVIAATFEHPDDGRDSTLSGAALGLAVGERPFDSCWVRFWPPTSNPLELLGVVVTGSGGVGEAVQWNPTLGRTLDPEAAFRALPLAGLTLAAAVVAAALAVVGVRLRRLELASARHVGVARGDLTGIALAEVACWLVPGTVLALTALGFAATWRNPEPTLAAWLAGARVVAAAAGTWLLAAGLATVAVRETRLVRYFQQR